MKKIIVLLILIVGLTSYSSSEIKIISLDEAVRTALQSNNQLKLIEQEQEGARGKRVQAKSAYFPKIKLNAGVTHFSESPDLLQLTNKVIGLNNAVNAMSDMALADYGVLKNYYTQLESANPGKYSQAVGTYNQLQQNQAVLAGMIEEKSSYPTNLNYFGAKVILEQPIYTGNKITAINKQAEENEKLADINVQIIKNNIVYDVKKAYYTVIQAEQMYNTAKEGLEALDEHYREAEAYFKAGLVTKADVSRADAKRAEIKQKLISAENGVKLAKAAFLFTIGDDIEKSFEIEDKKEYMNINITNEECVKRAFEKRAELKQIDSKIKLAEYSITIAKSEKLPLIALTGEIGEVTNRPFQKNNDEVEWQISLVGSYTLFDGGTVSGKIIESKSVVEQAKKGKELMKKGIEIEVKQAFLNVNSSLESIESVKKALIHSEETMKLAEEGYKAGLSSSLEVIDAQMALIQAKNNFTMVIGQYNISFAQLEKAMGTEKEEVFKSE